MWALPLPTYAAQLLSITSNPQMIYSVKRKAFLLFLSAALAVLPLQAASPARSFVSAQGYEFPANEFSLSYGRVSYPEIAFTIGGVLGAGLSFGTA